MCSLNKKFLILVSFSCINTREQHSFSLSHPSLTLRVSLMILTIVVARRMVVNGVLSHFLSVRHHSSYRPHDIASLLSKLILLETPGLSYTSNVCLTYSLFERLAANAGGLLLPRWNRYYSHRRLCSLYGVARQWQTNQRYTCREKFPWNRH